MTAPSTPYEVRCEHCKTSFAPETKACIHCGRPLRGGLVALLAGGAAAPGQQLPDAAHPHAGKEEEPGEALPLRGRNLVWIATAILAALLSAARTCNG